jgi:hypothetical protein
MSEPLTPEQVENQVRRRPRSRTGTPIMSEQEIEALFEPHKRRRPMREGERLGDSVKVLFGAGFTRGRAPATCDHNEDPDGCDICRHEEISIRRGERERDEGR